jgi:hypothetical protein
MRTRQLVGPKMNEISRKGEVMMGIWGLFLGFRGFSGHRGVFLGTWGLEREVDDEWGLPRSW